MLLRMAPWVYPRNRGSDALGDASSDGGGAAPGLGDDAGDKARRSAAEGWQTSQQDRKQRDSGTLQDAEEVRSESCRLKRRGESIRREADRRGANEIPFRVAAHTSQLESPGEEAPE